MVLELLKEHKMGYILIPTGKSYIGKKVLYFIKNL